MAPKPVDLIVEGATQAEYGANHDLGYDAMRRTAQIAISRMEAATKKISQPPG
jgi:hypothetical protein